MFCIYVQTTFSSVIFNRWIIHSSFAWNDLIAITQTPWPTMAPPWPPMAHHGQVLQLLEVFSVSNLFLDDLALRLALEAQLDRGDRPAPWTLELLGSPWAEHGHPWPPMTIGLATGFLRFSWVFKVDM